MPTAVRLNDTTDCLLVDHNGKSNRVKSTTIDHGQKANKLMTRYTPSRPEGRDGEGVLIRLMG